MQIKEYIKNNKNIFIYCIHCQHIFCNECWTKIKKEHNNYLLINEKNNKCIIHHKNDFYCYCFDDKKNLCNECLKDNTHLEHFKILFDEISPIKINNLNIEIKIFENIIKYFKQKINDIKETKKKEIEKTINKEKEELNYNYENKEKQSKINEEKEINNKKEELISKKEKIKQLYSNNLKIKAKNISQELNKKIINNSNINENFNFFEDKLDSINKIKINYNNEIINMKKNYQKEIEEVNNLNKKEINDIKEKYKTISNQNQKDYNNEKKKLDEKYSDNIKIIENEKNDFNINKYKLLIKLGETIFNTYNLHNRNYFNVKNMYNLMVIYYNNEEIYNNVVLKTINDLLNNKSLLELIEKKKNNKFNLL